MFRATRPLTADEFLMVVDDLHRGENQGGTIYDTYYADTHMNLIGVFLKAFRLKCGLLRGSYSSPFRVFELPLGSTSPTRFSTLTVKLGETRNIQRGHLYKTYDNLRILFDHLGFDQHYNSFDFVANTCEFLYFLIF